ncbi:hypothetical protein CHCC14596_1472 [Bacillus licheniformis]|nr:hypothetical protein CHCC14596_1472 [Bacillus licheniformis]
MTAPARAGQQVDMAERKRYKKRFTSAEKQPAIRLFFL